MNKGASTRSMENKAHSQVSGGCAWRDRTSRG